MSRFRSAALFTTPLHTPLAPVLLPWMFALVVAVLVVAGAVVSVVCATNAWLLGLVLTPLVTAFAVLAARVGFELLLGLALATEAIADLTERLARMEDAVTGISGDMPRLGFLRLRSPGGDREPAGPEQERG